MDPNKQQQEKLKKVLQHKMDVIRKPSLKSGQDMKKEQDQMDQIKIPQDDQIARMDFHQLVQYFNYQIKEESDIYFRDDKASEEDGVQNKILGFFENGCYRSIQEIVYLIYSNKSFPYVQQINLCLDSKRIYQLVTKNIHKFPNLEKIYFSGKQVKDDFIQKLVQNNLKLKSMTLTGTSISGRSLKALMKNLVGISQISFRQNPFEQKYLQFHQQQIKLVHLNRLVFIECGIVNPGKILLFSDFPSLKSLNLQNNLITDQGFQSIFQNHKKFEQLLSISLPSNKLSLKFLTNLYIFRQCFPKLQYINLQQNQLSKQYEKQRISYQLFQTLEQIKLENNQNLDIFSCIGLFALSPNLKTLHLKSVNLQDQGLKKIARNSKCFQSLVYLDVSKNNITDNGIKYFVEKQQQIFNNLTFFSCSRNQITDQGLKYFSKALNFPNIIHLCFRYNKISFNGVKLFIENVQKFPQLQTIKIHWTLSFQEIDEVEKISNTFADPRKKKLMYECFDYD